jgi:hypothetical protein
MGCRGERRAQPQRHVTPVAQVADGGDAGGQRARRGVPGAAQQLVVVHRHDPGDGVGARVEDQVDMPVDQTGQERHITEVHDPGIGRRHTAR